MPQTPQGSDALQAMQCAAAALYRDDHTQSVADEIASFTERDEVVGLSELQRLTGRLPTRH